MKVENVDGKIKIEGSYIEIATIVQALDSYWLTKDDEFVKELAYELHNPKVIVEK